MIAHVEINCFSIDCTYISLYKHNIVSDITICEFGFQLLSISVGLQ